MNATLSGGTSRSEEAVVLVGEAGTELCGEDWVVASARDAAVGWMITFAERRSQWLKTSFWPSMPGRSPRWFASHWSSCSSTALRFCWASVSVGRAQIHRCVTVQIFGVDMLDILLSAPNPLSSRCSVGLSWIAEIGRVACH